MHVGKLRYVVTTRTVALLPTMIMIIHISSRSLDPRQILAGIPLTAGHYVANAI